MALVERAKYVIYLLGFVQFYLKHVATIVVSGLEKLLIQLQAYYLPHVDL